MIVPRFPCALRNAALCAFAFALLAMTAYGQIVETTISRRPNGTYRLLREGQPYFVKGAGGSASLPGLKKAGANSLRTWGADNLGPTLDNAHRLGLTVCVGIWFGHKQHGFSYDNPAQVAKQYEQVRQAVTKYKKHPAVLVWALGNEMEAGNDTPSVWKAINNAALLVKRLDPHHPTMTVVAEISREKIDHLNTLCPAIDIIGINSYGGAPSLPARYREAGGVKPYILTEFGPAGVWESAKKPWGAVPELTSTEKGTVYRHVYKTAVQNQPLCLGSYAFTWGFKQEATATWYGMFLPDGSRLAAVDAMTEVWSGKPPAVRVPEIKTLRLNAPDQNPPGTVIKVTLEAADPQNLPLKVRWVLQKDDVRPANGGEGEPVPPTFPKAFLHADAKGAEIKMPQVTGAYRLFAYIHDGKGGAAVGNLPLFVKKETAGPILRKPALPLLLFAEPNTRDTTYAPTGWMGNAKAIRMDENSASRPHSSATCLKAEYTAGDGWGGVVWQSPAGDWGDKPGGLNLSGAKRLTFWARGEKGGEEVTFEFGLLGAEKSFGDSATGKRDKVSLSADWQQYTIDLTGLDLTHIKTGFAWVVAGQGKPVTFYLDDIRYE